MILKNKKAEGEKILTPGIFIIWVVVGVVIGISVVFLLSSNIDVRQEQSRILATRVVNCLVEDGILRSEVLNENFDIYKFCYFNKEVLDKDKTFYFKVSFLNEGGKDFREAISGGNSEFVTLCGLESSEDKFAKCSLETINVLVKEGSNVVSGRLKIFTGSNNNGGKLK